MDESLFCGTLKGGATVAESRVLRALARAYRDNCHERFAYCNQLGNTVFAIYDAPSGEQYAVVPLVSCDCKAGEHGMICKHIVACCDKLGRMDWLIPDFYGRFIPPASAQPLEAA
jgi:hypothetical protein